MLLLQRSTCMNAVHSQSVNWYEARRVNRPRVNVSANVMLITGGYYFVGNSLETIVAPRRNSSLAMYSYHC